MGSAEYTIFHLSWIIFNFNINQLGTVSALVIISVPWSNEHVHEVITKLIYFPKDFKVLLRATGMPTLESCCLHSYFLPRASKMKGTMLKIVVVGNPFLLCISQFQAPAFPPGDLRGFALYCCPGAGIYT